MNGMAGDPPPPPPPFSFWISIGDRTRIAYAKFHGILIAGYILNEFKYILCLDATVSLSNTRLCL